MLLLSNFQWVLWGVMFEEELGDVCSSGELYRLVHTVTATTKTKRIFPSVSVVMEWVLHPIVTATATEKIGVMATGVSVHTVAATATEIIRFFSTFHCRCRRSVNEPYIGPLKYVECLNIKIPETG